MFRYLNLSKETQMIYSFEIYILKLLSSHTDDYIIYFEQCNTCIIISYLYSICAKCFIHITLNNHLFKV